MKTCDGVLDRLLSEAVPLAPVIAVASSDRALIETAVDAAGIPIDAVQWMRETNEIPTGPGLSIIDLRDGDPASVVLAYMAAGEPSSRLHTIVIVGDDVSRVAQAVEPWARIVPASRPDRLAAAIAAACMEVQARFAVDRVIDRAVREERRLEAMLAACDDFIGLLDGNGVVLKIGAHDERRDGYSADELIGTNALSHLHPQDVDGVRDRFAKLVRRSGERDHFRARRRHKDGAYGVYDITAINLLHDRHVAGVVVHFRDVSEAGAAQAALRVSEARLQLIAARLPIVLWIADPVMARCEYVSPFFEPLWGRSRGDLLTNAGAWSSGIHPDDRASVPEPIAPISRPMTFNFRVVRPDGGLSYVECHRTPVIDEHGQLVRIVGVAIDVTERRQLEHQLVEAQALAPLAHLAGSVAHDFNNIIGGIQMVTAIVLSEDHEDALRADLESISQLTERGVSLTQRLLDFVRRRPTVLEPLSVGAVVRGMRGILRLLLGAGIDLEIVVADDLPPIDADRTQLEQIILNLAINARDAMDGRGTLRVVVIASETGVRLSIADTGSGMDAPTRARIFEPFFTTKARGTGLGLSTVAAAVRAHGASIRVESEPGLGTVFDVLFPTRALPAQKPRT